MICVCAYGAEFVRLLFACIAGRLCQLQADDREHALRVFSGFWGIVIMVQALGKYMILRYLDP